MMRFLLMIAVCISVAACSDFFRTKTLSSPGGGGLSRVNLPEKATLDAQACAYGPAPSQEVNEKFIWDMASARLCPQVREFRYELTRLRLAVDDHCAQPDFKPAERDVESFFRHSMTAYSYLAGNPFGPLHADGGKLASEIYSWPSYNRYALNAELIKAHTQGDNYNLRLSATRKGLAAVEGLIFNKNATLSPGLSGELRPEEAEFNALPLAQRNAARCRVLRAMVGDVALRTEDVYTRWSASGEGYVRRLAEEMAAGRTHMLLNELSDGLYYLEQVKDYKLGLPLGLNARCREQEKCPNEVELNASGLSLEALRANVNAFRDAMLGVDGSLGFVHLLERVGRGDLADRFRVHLSAVEADMAELEKGPSLREQVIAADKAQCGSDQSPFAVCRMFHHTKNMMILYKSEFMSALNLQPPRTEMDND